MSNLDAVRARLALPELGAQELAVIAQHYPELHLEVAAHPAVYPDLLAWLAEHGTAPTATAAAPVAPLIPLAPAVAPTPQAAPDDVPVPAPLASLEPPSAEIADAAPTSTVLLELGFPFFAIFYALCRPVITIDGQYRVRGWGTQRLEVPAHGVRLDIYVRYFGFRVGKAGTWIDPATTPHLQYRAPHVTFYSGSLGPYAKSQGLGCLIFMILGSLILPLLIVIIAVAVSM